MDDKKERLVVVLLVWDDCEEWFKLFVESVCDYVIFMLDLGGYVISWNVGVECFKGYCFDEIIGSYFSCFYLVEVLVCGQFGYEFEMVYEWGFFEDEGWCVCKDGLLFWVNVVIMVMCNLVGELVGFVKVMCDFIQWCNYEEVLCCSEECFWLLVEGVFDYVIFMFDVNGCVVIWNIGVQCMKGYMVDEILSQYFFVFYFDEVKVSGWFVYEL